MEEKGREKAEHLVCNTITCFSASGLIGCGECQACLRKWIAMEFAGLGYLVNSAFEKHPLSGASKYVENYQLAMTEALRAGDFRHYSKKRCEITLEVLNKVV